MPATGNLTSELLEVADVVTVGVYTDVTEWLDGNVAPRCTEGRSSRFDDFQPARLEFTLQNYDGRWTPDNPASPYAGRWRRGVFVKYSIAKLGFFGNTLMHWGRVIDIRPSLVDGVTSWAVVQVTCTDAIGALATRDMGCDFVERWQSSARLGADLDLWPFDEGVSTPTTLKNLAGGASGTVYRPATQVGSITTEAPDGIDLDGSLAITASDAVGPIVSLPITNVATVQDVVIPFRTADRVPAGAAARWIASGRDASSSVLWSLRLVDNGGQTDVNVYDAAGAFVATLYFRFAPTGDDAPGDDQWFTFRIGWNGTQTFLNLVRNIDDAVLNSVNTSALDPRGTTEVVLGGQAHRFARGKQVQCVTARFGAVAVSDTVNGHTAYLEPNAATTLSVRAADVALYTGVSVGLVGTANPDVIRTPMSGRKAFDVVAELARTVGGVVRRNYGAANAITFVAPDSARPATPVLTIDAAADLEADEGVETADSVDTRPTRVTVSYPGGSVVVLGDESNGQRVDGSIQTCAVSEDHARSIGGSIVNAGTALAFTRLVVDLTTTDNNLWVAALTMRAGDRIRLSGTPTDIYGRTYQDLYVLGYAFETPQQGCRLTLDTEPADSPAEGRADDAVYGRASAEPGAMTITGGTAVGTTASGSVIVTTASGPTLSTDSADYPLDLNWNGERITAPTAPASSTSPQTLTGVTRGVVPSIVRVHVAGEPVDVWFPATATF